MNISDKLAFYKAEQKPLPDDNISSSLLALSDHFNGEILFDGSAVLKIPGNGSYPHFSNKQIDINLVSKNQFDYPVPRENCVFFDLETTGLAGGAGTFAFLIGFAWWEDDILKTEQYFLPDFGREYALFNRIQSWLEKFEYIISYNGKSYDMPLLSNRFVLNRLQPDFKNKKHIDIVHLCRRIWKNSLPSCSLKSIETLLLNIIRKDDIPGEYIPQAYFNYIQTGNIHEVIRMIEHNRLDIVSLALIFDKLHFISHNLKALPIDENALGCLAKLACTINNPTFFNFFKSTDVINIPDSVKYWLSLYYKKNHAWEKAFILWVELSHNAEYYMFAQEEIAKYYEHKKQDLQAALNTIQKVFKRFEIEEDLGIRLFDYSIKIKFEKRYQRIRHKIAAKAC
jgi:hypothetical protein